MIRIAICDDDSFLSEKIQQCLQRITRENIESSIYESAAELLSNIEKNGFFDIYLLDIEMPLMGGMELAQSIRKKDEQAIIIFLTSHNEYVYDAFKIQAFRFLQKPVQFEKLKEAIESAALQVKEKKCKFFFQWNRCYYCVSQNQIIYIEKNLRKILIHTKQIDYFAYMKMKDVLKQLNMTLFSSVSASCAVNVAEIRSIHKDVLLTNDNSMIPISKKFRKEIKEKHLQYEMERI